jgi:hypothetical protein
LNKFGFLCADSFATPGNLYGTSQMKIGTSVVARLKAIDQVLAQWAFAITATVLLASCGSGAVSSDSAPNVPLTLSPGTATAYSGVPTTLTVAGGGARGPYTFSSTNGQVVPVPTTPQQSTSLTITPSTVSASQNVSITVRDQAGQMATTAVTVQPNFVAGDITVSGTAAAATGIANCSITGAVCAGQSGLVTVTISQLGAPVGGRSVRFEAVQGNFRFATDQAQTQFASSVTVTSDNQGKAVAIIRADPGSFQNAIIRATDVTTGAFRSASFFIRQATVAGAEYSVVPEIWNVGSQYKNECLGGSVDFLIFGGTPPYNILAATQLVIVSPTRTPNENPSRFTATFPVVQCGVDGYEIPFTVTDARNLTLSPKISVKPGTEDKQGPLPALVVSPNSVVMPCTTTTGSSVQVLTTIANPGSTAPTIVAAVTTPVAPSSALTAVVPANGNVVTITRSNQNITSPSSVPPAYVSLAVTIGAGAAGTQTVAVSTPGTCPP